MIVKCIKKMRWNFLLDGLCSTDSVFTSIKVGDWIEVYEKSIYDMTNKDPNSSSSYFYNPPHSAKHIEYAFNKSNFITLDQWRDKQLNTLLDNE